MNENAMHPADLWDGRLSDHIRPRGYRTVPTPAPAPVGEVPVFHAGDRVAVGGTIVGTVHRSVIAGAPKVPVEDDVWRLVSYHPAHTLTVVTAEQGAA